MKTAQLKRCRKNGEMVALGTKLASVNHGVSYHGIRKAAVVAFLDECQEMKDYVWRRHGEGFTVLVSVQAQWVYKADPAVFGGRFCGWYQEWVRPSDVIATAAEVEAHNAACNAAAEKARIRREKAEARLAAALEIANTLAPTQTPGKAAQCRPGVVEIDLSQFEELLALAQKAKEAGITLG